VWDAKTPGWLLGFGRWAGEKAAGWAFWAWPVGRLLPFFYFKNCLLFVLKPISKYILAMKFSRERRIII
jgi:hypothetical protein